MRTLLMIGLIVAMGLSTAVAQEVAADSATTPRARDVDTVALLNQRIPEVSFQEAPLESVVDWAQDFTQINFVVRWDVLEEMGINRDKPISITVRNLRLSQVLWMIMSEASGGETKLAYRASGNLLIFSTAEDLDKEMLVKVYEVSDLLFRVQSFYGAPQLDLTQNNSAGGQGGGSQNIFGGSSGGSGNDDDNNNRQGRDGEEDTGIGELIDVIMQTIEPDSWRDNGGQGTITPFRKQLIVRNSIFVHQALGGYLSEEGE